PATQAFARAGDIPEAEEAYVLENAKVLIVEDEGLIALEIADLVEAAGGSVIGPVPTVAAALALIEAERIDAAIPDGNLADRDITPVALQLRANAVPTIIYSGVGLPGELATHLPDLPLILKSTPVSSVVLRLGELMKRSRGN
ncbi:MAG: response regulator, partial [Rhizorhabdus sp.]|nr:response regulator [Rhizorhabdus sp.]